MNSSASIVSFTPEYRSELIARVNAFQRGAVRGPSGGPMEEGKPGEYGSFVKTARIMAIKIPVPFVVQTEHGSMDAKAGDWLATNHPLDDDTSDIWPISAERFAATYAPSTAFGTLQAALDADVRTIGEVAGAPVPLQEYSPDGSPKIEAAAVKHALGRVLGVDTEDVADADVDIFIAAILTASSPRAARDVSRETHHELGGEG